MLIDQFLQQLQNDPQSIDFSDTMALIDSHYDFTETAFTNGKLHNAAGQNNGSCKIFAFALLNRLNEAETLHCFGDYYREDVLENPQGDDHQNIRNFMTTGWDGIHFTGTALSKKA